MFFQNLILISPGPASNLWVRVREGLGENSIRYLRKDL